MGQALHRRESRVTICDALLCHRRTSWECIRIVSKLYLICALQVRFLIVRSFVLRVVAIGSLLIDAFRLADDGLPVSSEIFLLVSSL